MLLYDDEDTAANQHNHWSGSSACSTNSTETPAVLGLGIHACRLWWQSFEHHRKLEDGDPDQIELSLNENTYERLRIRFITDPIKGSASYTTVIEDTLQEVSSKDYAVTYYYLMCPYVLPCSLLGS